MRFGKLPVIILALVVAGALLVSGREAAARVPQFAAWVRSLGFWGPAAFKAATVAALGKYPLGLKAVEVVVSYAPHAPPAVMPT